MGGETGDRITAGPEPIMASMLVLALEHLGQIAQEVNAAEPDWARAEDLAIQLGVEVQVLRDHARELKTTPR